MAELETRLNICWHSTIPFLFDGRTWDLTKTCISFLPFPRLSTMMAELETRLNSCWHSIIPFLLDGRTWDQTKHLLAFYCSLSAWSQSVRPDYICWHSTIPRAINHHGRTLDRSKLAFYHSLSLSISLFANQCTCVSVFCDKMLEETLEACISAFGSLFCPLNVGRLTSLYIVFI